MAVIMDVARQTSVLMECNRLRYVAGTHWGNKKYMKMKHLEASVEDTSIAR